ncbi:MAG: Fe-S cluster assembly protein HesB [Ignavibacteria bacterium]|nr:Fe-S cluster assembly protein HesB [Ignavibacteria bacterium]MBI3765870.1 Fe-S cluster assembly protein HesB [Ignavibacteriales bacterium]
MKLTLTVPPNFHFWRTVYSHGWCSLPPFEVRKDEARLHRLFALSSGTIVEATIEQRSPSRVIVEAHQEKTLTAEQKRELLRHVKTCVRLDEDYDEFYHEAKKYKQYRWIPKSGAGRLLRAPTVFEDVVKMICTTNCSWALTEVMVENLCKKLGFKIHDAGYTFPNSEAIAGCTEKFLRKEIRVGYRAPYLLELSRRISKGELKIELWRTSTIPTGELFEEVRSVKGVGPYAAGNILKLLGRYDYLGIDSWCRKQFFEIHKNGRKTSDRVIEKFYEPFGKWRGLFFWLDVTKHWYEKKFPF